MPRGGRSKTLEREDGLDRRCVATGESAPRQGLIRFVAAPDGTLTPDLAEKLPGRGVWVSSTRAALDKAVAKRLFARGLKRPVTIPDGLTALVERLLVVRAGERLALARKAGAAVCGFEKVRAALISGNVATLLAATDASDGGQAKLRGPAGNLLPLSLLDSQELGLAFGRASVIHAALLRGGTSEAAERDLARLSGFRA